VTRPARSANELRGASEHVLYEIEMLYSTHRDLESLHRLNPPGKNEPLGTHNALIESWTVHVRNLMEFLRSTVGRDYILARDYFPAGRWHELLPRRKRDEAEREIDRRINKEIVHLTYARLAISREEKMWDMGEVTAKVDNKLRVFVAHVPSDYVQQDFCARARLASEAFRALDPRTERVNDR
jgi:hypothetical protein